VRSIDRRREMAVRAALGASRTEIARQLLIEAIVLVAVGTLAGVLLAAWMRPIVAQLAFEQFGAIANRELAISWRAIGVVTSLALVCGVLFGLLPTLHTVRRNLVDALRRGVTASPGERGLRRLFVGGEVALAFVLLVSMALLGRTLINLLNVSPGFDPRGVLRMSLALPRANYPTPARVASFYSTLQGALQDRLGVRAIAVVDELPLTHNRGRLLVSARPGEAGREAVVRTASPGYFDVMRIPVASGRGFDMHDDAAAPRRVVISESLASRLFPREPAVGQQIQLGANGQMADIVGVVGDVAHRALGDPVMPTLYVSGLQVPSPGSILVVRRSLPEADVRGMVQEEVARLDASLPVYGVRPMEEVVAASAGMPARRLLMAVFSGFALVALVLSAIGLFGVAAHDVASRRPELALRLALGADPRRLLRATLAQGAALVAAGLAVGGVLSIWAARALGSVLVTTGRFDALSVGVAAAILLAAGVAANLPAALRAARTDPLIALRSE
jgi:putative ABC transport system permease protein